MVATILVRRTGSILRDWPFCFLAVATMFTPVGFANAQE
jgi:hypothetical protein